jgi:hypothetical protein
MNFKSKLQIPNKLQIPISNDLNVFACDFEIDPLEFICYLVLALYRVRYRAWDLVLAHRAYLPNRFLNSSFSIGTAVKRSATTP